MVARRDEEFPDDLLSVPEAAKLLRVSPSTVWRWISEGRLPSYKVGLKKVRVRRPDLLGMLVVKQPRPARLSNDLKQYLVPNPYADPDWERAVDNARLFSEELLRKNGGRLFSDSTADINEAREERTNEL